MVIFPHFWFQQLLLLRELFFMSLIVPVMVFHPRKLFLYFAYFISHSHSFKVIFPPPPWFQLLLILLLPLEHFSMSLLCGCYGFHYIKVIILPYFFNFQFFVFSFKAISPPVTLLPVVNSFYLVLSFSLWVSLFSLWLLISLKYFSTLPFLPHFLVFFQGRIPPPPWIQLLLILSPLLERFFMRIPPSRYASSTLSYFSTLSFPFFVFSFEALFPLDHWF